jgi:hypothetical protein
LTRSRPLATRFSSLSGSNGRCILPFFCKSVLFFYIHHPDFNHLFAYPLCLSPFPQRSRTRSPQLAEHFFYTSCWTALSFEELLSTTYLVPLLVSITLATSAFLGAHHALVLVRARAAASSSALCLAFFSPPAQVFSYLTPQ